MAASSLRLYDICLRRTARILKGKFRDESPNPFSAIPPSIVHDLVTYTLYSEEGFRAQYLEPLLLGGQVKHLALRDVRLEEELLPTLRSFTVCRGLRSLSLINICEFDLAIVSGLLEELLKSLKNLEELHCSVSFGLSALRKCRKLKTARLHFTPECALDDLLDGENDPRQTLSLLTLCGQRAEKFPHFKEVAALLLICPELRSLGYIDVSAAFGYLHSSGASSVRKYSLESCCWREYRTIERGGVSEERFLSSIRAAASACPNLKELVIKIPQCHYQGALSVLHTLSSLTYLEIELDCSKRNFRPEIFCLLSGIGSGLRHLALHRIDNIEFDAILQSCPLLESLKVDCDQVVGDWSETSVSPRQLQRLTFFSSDGCCYGSNSLRLMLSKCCNLQELFLKNSEFLSDSFLSRILKESPTAFSKLKTACLSDCCLTQDGLKKFLSSAKRLERISVESSKMSEEDTECQICRFNSALTIIPDYDEGLRNEFFYRRRYECA